MTQRTFDVDGLRCAGCVNTVSETLIALEDVKAVEVTLRTAEPSVVRLEADGDVDLDLVQRSLAKQGDFRILR